MSDKPKIHRFTDMRRLATRLRDELNGGGQDFVLLYAYNGTGKTRLSMEFKDAGKRKNKGMPDTLYFNAFTEDLFSWDNDLENDSERRLHINTDSTFFKGLKELALDERIGHYLSRYADFLFDIDYDQWTVSFRKGEARHIKVSRGEENIFIWCVFMAICERVIDGAESYQWVRYLYVDDPITSLDDNNAIAVASDLATLLRKASSRTLPEAGAADGPDGAASPPRRAPAPIKAVVSSHHALFFNVVCNELKKDTPILSTIVTLDSQEPATGQKQRLESVMDFACGSGSLLLNVRKRMGPHGIGKIYGQEKNITTYNLARMNMLLHGVKDTEFEIFHGDTLTNDWDMLRELNPARKPAFDAIVANPPFSYRWENSDALADDVRFKNHGLAPKSAADFAFLLHGFHFLKDEGVMAIILPHGVLFRGGAEANIRTKLLKDGHIDTVIGLPSNLFYSTGIPVCILVLKKCKKPDDVLFINASGPENFVKDKRQNKLLPEHIARIIKTYQTREPQPRYARNVGMEEIEKNDFNLNISRYVSTAVGEAEIDLDAVHAELVAVERAIAETKQRHNSFLKELGLKPLP